jgi:hypothetical protein
MLLPGEEDTSICIKVISKQCAVHLTFRNMSVKSAVIINSDSSETKNFTVDESYLADFVETANKRSFSFVKTVLNNSCTVYYLVAKPAPPLKTEQIPPEIRKKSIESKYNGIIETPYKY